MNFYERVTGKKWVNIHITATNTNKKGILYPDGRVKIGVFKFVKPGEYTINQTFE